MLKIDVHVHPSLSKKLPFSKEHIRNRINYIEWICKWKDLDGVIYTEHFQNPFFWKVQKILQSKDNEILSVPGAEIRLDNGTDVIVFGKLMNIKKLDRSFPSKLSNGHFPKLEELWKKTRELNLKLISAHHLRKGNYENDEYKYFDAIELDIKNPEKTDKIRKIAAQHSLPLISGSDAHLPHQVGIGWSEVSDLDELRQTRVHQRDNCEEIDKYCNRIKEHILSYIADSEN